MDDERTKQWMIDAAEKKCTCASCMKEKALKEEKALKAFEASLELPSKIVKPMPGNFIPNLSSNPMYWRLGRRA